LSAAFYLLRQGHAVTIADRHPQAGGSLRRGVDRKLLPEPVLDAEIRQLERLGVQFRLGAALGKDVTIDGLLRGFDAVLLTVGEITKAEADQLGVETVPGGIKAKPDTHQTSRRGVFAAGRATKPVAQLVRAMSEGLAAAECIGRFLEGTALRRSEKPFSSVMGRLQDGELKAFVESASPAHTHIGEPACGCLTEANAGAEAARCLHCDCRSSGDCALQSYAQAYGADASRFREQRRTFEQFEQPGGVIFEPGKCILCGICVKLTEMAQEPLGLTFIGRGFDVRLAAPFNRTIEEGLQKVAEECVRHCPTGALVFKESQHPGVEQTTSSP
jgi:ferredoxin